MTTALWLDLVLSSLVITGVFFALVGSIGLVKLSDFMKRLHGPTKASTLGVGCLLIASMIYFAVTGEASLHELLISLFIFMTAPISAHLLVKAALRADPRIAPPDPAAPDVTDRRTTAVQRSQAPPA